MTAIPDTNPDHALFALLFLCCFLFFVILLVLFHLARQLDRILAWLDARDDATEVAPVAKDANRKTLPYVG